MKTWFADGVFRTVLRNAGYLGSSKLVGAGFGLLALALAGRGLTPATFGVLMIVHTYASGAGGIVKFQTWQYIVRFAAPALHRADPDQATDVIGFAFGLDLVSGLAGMVGAMALLPFVASRFGIARDDLWLAIAYCTLVPTMSAATATGALRVLDRFDLIASQQIVTPLLRAVGAVLSFFLDLGFGGFVLTWYVADLLGDLVLWYFAVRELRGKGLGNALKPTLFSAPRRVPGSWTFVWTTNVAHSVYAAWGPVGNLVVASLLGPVAAGMYKIASAIADSAAKPADLLRRGYYPEIMRLDPRTERPWHLGFRAGALAGGVAVLVLLVVLLVGKPLIAVAFGRKYLEAYPLLKLMAFSLVVSIAFFPLESLLYMAGRQTSALAAQLVAVVGYLAILVVLCRSMGLYGAGLAYLIGSLLVAGCLLVPTMGGYRRRRELAWDGPPT